MAAPATAALVTPTAATLAAPAEAEINLDGTLVVATFDYADDSDSDEVLAPQAKSLVYAVRTVSGGTVRLAGDLPEGSNTGDYFSGTVSVPSNVLDELTAKQAKSISTAADPSAADSLEAVAAQRAASELGVSLPVSEAKVSSASAATGPVVAHSLYIAIPDLPEMGGEIGESEARTLGTTVADYWKAQSEGTIEGFTVAAVRSYGSALDCLADPFDRWDEAAAGFGDPSGDMFFNDSGNHLVVMLPAECRWQTGIVGLGTIGDSLDLGGAVEVVVGRVQLWSENADEHAVAHEIGHNLGLGDANLRYCGLDAAYVGCESMEAGDLYDVMGDGMMRYGITSLNSASKVALGFVGDASAPTVSLQPGQSSAVFDISLPSVSNLSGVQLFKIIDPSTGEVRYLENRAGDGSDSGSWYRVNETPWIIGGPFVFNAGVRLLEINEYNETSALTRWVGRTDALSAHAESALTLGTSMTTADGGIKVEYLSGIAPAQVRITLDRGATPAGVPVYRFWSAENQTHFYTINADEKKSVEDDYPDDVWKYEFVAYRAFTTQAPGTVPLYRFWSSSFGGHFYTTSMEERDFVRDNYTDEIWHYENIAYFVYPASTPRSDVTPVYRFWSETNKHHFYTASAAERDAVDRNYDDLTWKYEWEVFKVPNS